MIVTSQDAQKRSFVGVDFLLLSHGKESMVTKMLYKNGNTVPIHKHPNEQSGYVISVKYILILDDARHEIGTGHIRFLLTRSMALNLSSRGKCWIFSALRDRIIWIPETEIRYIK